MLKYSHLVKTQRLSKVHFTNIFFLFFKTSEFDNPTERQWCPRVTKRAFFCTALFCTFLFCFFVYLLFSRIEII